LKELINSFGVARDSFRRADDFFSALNSQFNGLKLLDESPKRKKAAGGRLPKAPQPRANDQQDSTPDQLSIAANPHMLLRSAAKKDSEQSDQSAVEGAHPGIAKDSELSALVSQPVIPSISLPPQGNIETGLPAQIGTNTICRAKAPAVVPLKKQIFVSRLYPDQTSSDVLSYIQDKTKADNIKVEKCNFSYARVISSFKITLPNEFFSTVCSGDFWPDSMVGIEFEAKIKNRKKRPVGIKLPMVRGQTTAPSASSSSSSSKN